LVRATAAPAAAVSAPPAEGERPPAWLWALSWAFWLSVAAAVGGFGLGRIRLHQEQLVVGHAAWRQRFEICKQLSEPPRPSWRECLVRMEGAGPGFLAKATPGFIDPNY
jgi:hypothetical protein